jgi:hypothetical protein
VLVFHQYYEEGKVNIQVWTNQRGVCQFTGSIYFTDNQTKILPEQCAIFLDSQLLVMQLPLDHAHSWYP